MVLDNTLTTIRVTCPECGFKRAIYFLVSDEKETKMIAKLMCKNITGSTVKCGHIWELNDFSEITEKKIKIK